MRWISLYTRTYVLWVIVFGVLAYLFPAPFLTMKNHMTWLFAVTMFGIGVTLHPEDFRNIARQPRIVAIGAATQFLVMPFSAFAIAWLLDLPGPIATGLILTGAAPDAMAGNVITYLAKADTAYAISLTTVSTLLSPVLTPGLTLLLAGARIDVPFSQMFWDVCVMVVFPLLGGFALRAIARRQIERVLPVFPALSATFIVFICALVVAGNRESLVQMTGIVLVACLILNIFGLIMGYAAGWLFRMSRARRRTLAIEVGMQNAGLGAVLALKHLGQEAAMPAAIFVFVCIFTASLLAAYWRRRTEEEPDVSEMATSKGGLS